MLNIYNSKFKKFVVSTNFTVKMVIENTLNKNGDGCKGWAATEVVELGNGCWDKVSASAITLDPDVASEHSG